MANIPYKHEWAAEFERGLLLLAGEDNHQLSARKINPWTDIYVSKEQVRPRRGALQCEMLAFRDTVVALSQRVALFKVQCFMW